MSYKSYLYLVVLLLEIVIGIVLFVSHYKEISTGNSTKDYLKIATKEYSLKIILPSLIIFIVSLVGVENGSETLLVMYLLLIASRISKKISDACLPPSELKIPFEFREHYSALISALEYFSNCEYKLSIAKTALQDLHIYSRQGIFSPGAFSSGYNETQERAFISFMHDNRRKERYESWAICYIIHFICIRDRSSKLGNIMYDYFKKELEERKSNTITLPTELLYAYREVPCINDIYEYRLEI